MTDQISLDAIEDRYPTEVLRDDYDWSGDDTPVDNGTMPDNVEQLRSAVVGHRIVSAEKRQGLEGPYWRSSEGLVLTLDNGVEVQMMDTDDCCAFTALEGFFLDPSAVDHVILGVGTTGHYSTWHIYADFGDVMKLDVGWSAGNPFYYGYGFDIVVKDPNVRAAD